MHRSAFQLDPELAARVQRAAAGEPVQVPGHDAIQANWEAPDLPEVQWTPRQRAVMTAPREIAKRCARPRYRIWPRRRWVMEPLGVGVSDCN